MSIYVLIVLASWLVLLFYWIVAAMRAKKNVRGTGRRWLGSRLLIAVIVFLLIRAEFLNMYTNYYAPDGMVHVIKMFGVVLCIVGVAFAIWARVYLGTNWGMSRSVKKDPELVTKGPYEYVRHPIYSGILLAALGSSFVDIGWMLVFLVYGAYFFYSARKEEELMQQQFPSEYKTYKKHTKMLIPFVY